MARYNLLAAKRLLKSAFLMNISLASTVPSPIKF